MERQRLLDWLPDLQAEDWQRPTACPGWTVLDLCAHLVGDDVGWLARHRDGHEGPVPPSDDEDAFIDWLDELQDQWVRASRRLSPRLVTELLSWTGPQIALGLAGEDKASVSARVSWAGDGLQPVWLDQLRELSEHWIHRQQLREAVGRASDLRPDLAGPVFDGLRWAYPYRLSELMDHAGAAVTITVTGPVTRTWHIVAETDGWRFAPRPGSHPVATLTMEADDAWRILTNNLRADRYAHLDTTGDQTIVDVLCRTRAIVGRVQ
jgi:uncharacterized protein (TIGR03083 family)